MAQEKLTKARYIEYEASIFGACFIAFGLGVVFAGYFQKFAFLLILIGIVVHGWGMFKILQRNT